MAIAAKVQENLQRLSDMAVYCRNGLAANPFVDRVGQEVSDSASGLYTEVLAPTTKLTARLNDISKTMASVPDAPNAPLSAGFMAMTTAAMAGAIDTVNTMVSGRYGVAAARLGKTTVQALTSTALMLTQDAISMNGELPPIPEMMGDWAAIKIASYLKIKPEEMNSVKMPELLPEVVAEMERNNEGDAAKRLAKDVGKTVEEMTGDKIDLAAAKSFTVDVKPEASQGADAAQLENTVTKARAPRGNVFSLVASMSNAVIKNLSLGAVTQKTQTAGAGIGV